jgi:hypothetical protein
MERIFCFVRDEIPLSFIKGYYVSAEYVLKKRRGVCMNKAVLLVAMAREAGIPSRFHYSWVTPACLFDLIHSIHYKNLPNHFLHIFAEVKLKNRWVPMDAIFDNKLFEALVRKKLNFARYPEKENLSNEFSSSGVIGGPMLFEVKDGGYGDDLAKFKENDPTTLFQRLLMPFVFYINNKIIKKIRYT